MAKTKVEEKTKSKISNESFIEIWQRAETLEDVAEKVGTTLMATRARGNALRAKGVKSLKKFPRKKLDYSKLDEKAEDLL
jgi:hypothetical protein